MKQKCICCGNYLAVFERHQHTANVIDLKSKIEYNQKPVEKCGKFFSAKHCMIGYSAYGEGVDKPSKYYTLRFADCTEGMKIEPYTGNTIITEYKAIFRVPKPKGSTKQKQFYEYRRKSKTDSGRMPQDG